MLAWWCNRDSRYEFVTVNVSVELQVTVLWRPVECNVSMKNIWFCKNFFMTYPKPIFSHRPSRNRRYYRTTNNRMKMLLFHDKEIIPKQSWASKVKGTDTYRRRRPSGGQIHDYSHLRGRSPNRMMDWKYSLISEASLQCRSRIFSWAESRYSPKSYDISIC